MSRIRFAGLSLITALALTSLARVTSAQGTCRQFDGRLSQTLIPAPNDPLGRVLGTTGGAIKGSHSSIITSLVPQVDGSLLATTNETFVTGPGDLLYASGSQQLAPVAGAAIGTVTSTATLTITGGTGKYAGATGVLITSGTGHNLFGPAAGPGSTTFDLEVSGQVCFP